jgi:outer membrane protein assembly factor BamB
VEAVARVENGVLAASLDNYVYLFTLTGKKIWKRQLPGRPSSQPLTTADAALFTPLSSTTGIVLRLRDGRTVNILQLDEEITTSAAPVAVDDSVLITTEHGLVAFTRPNQKLGQ